MSDFIPNRVAVFVDGDNISSDYSKSLMAIAKRYGQPDVVRVYGNERALVGWSKCPEFHFVYAGCGKNAADLLLAIVVMDFTSSQHFDAILICSSDGDFSHLATRLRENGNMVVGLGETKTPDRYRCACSAFRLLQDDAVQEIPKRRKSTASDLDTKIKRTIILNGTVNEGIRIADLAPIMHSQHGIKISQRPEKTWRGYLSKRQDLYDLDPKGAEAKVRFKTSGFEV